VHNLSNLRELNLVANKLNGAVPDGIETLETLGECTAKKGGWGSRKQPSIYLSISQSSNDSQILEKLLLDKNEFAGGLQSIKFSQMTSLKNIHLQENRLIGTIPDDFNNMPNLETFKLSDNDLSGFIPASLTRCPQLQEIALEYNQLTGTVPTEFGLLEKLLRFSIQENELHGSMPEEVCKLVESNDLKFLTADCDKEHGVQCFPSCCSECF
jgi:Leucine-rich repeat (LRR) protein